MHGRDIGGQIRARAVGDQKDAAEVHVIVHQHTPHMVHAGAHVVQLLAEICLGGQPVFQREYKVALVGQQPAVGPVEPPVSHKEPAAVDVHNHRKLRALLRLRLEDIHGQGNLVPVDIGHVQRLLHVLIDHRLRRAEGAHHIHHVHALGALHHGAHQLALYFPSDSIAITHKSTSCPAYSSLDSGMASNTKSSTPWSFSRFSGDISICISFVRSSGGIVRLPSLKPPC